jgi:hypothetical protein
MDCDLEGGELPLGGELALPKSGNPLHLLDVSLVSAFPMVADELAFNFRRVFGSKCCHQGIVVKPVVG